MNIDQKVKSTEKVLGTTSQLISFCVETKTFIHNTQKSLFAKILAKDDLSEEQKKNEIDIATAGILVVALSSHSSRYKYLLDNENNLSPYLWNEKGYLKSAYYPIQYEDVLAISGINESTEQDNKAAGAYYERLVLDKIDANEPTEQDNKAAGAYYERLVLAVGTKVMNGELPFQPNILSEIFDKHTQDALKEMVKYRDFPQDPAKDHTQDLLNDIAALKEYVSLISAKINKASRSNVISSNFSKTATYDAYIKSIFNRALNMAATGNDTPEKKKFVEGVAALKQATLASFQKGETNFGLKDCETIAYSALTLATKVGSNTVTQADVNKFTQATQNYKTSHAFAIALAVMIGAVIGMIAGAAIGFAVGGVPGAIVGGVAGLVVGDGITGVSSTMWYTKKEPLNKVSSAAAEMVPSQPAP